MKYTKGPWRAVIEGQQPQPMYHGLIAMIQSGDGFKAVVAESEYVPKEEWEGNCRLIAAAPDLLEALKEARAYVVGAYECAFPDDLENQRVLADIDAAIAKATGGAQ